MICFLIPDKVYCIEAYQEEDKMDEQEKFLSANHKRLLRIATWAKYLAWIVLIGYFLYAAALYAEKQNIYLHYGGFCPQKLILNS